MSNKPSIYCELVEDEIPQDRCEPVEHEKCESCSYRRQKAQEEKQARIKDPVRVSKYLQDILETQFQRMCCSEKKLPEEKEEDRLRRDRERKQRERELEKIEKACASFCTVLKNKNTKNIEKHKNRLMKEGRKLNQEILDLESTSNPLYGKSSRIDFNGFALRCYCHIKKENPKQADIKIFRWIEEFLKARGYKKAKKGNYNTNDIKQIISCNYLFKESEMRRHYEACFNQEYTNP